MEMITKWIADDGEEFEDEDQCREHELRNKKFYGFIAYDFRKEPISIKDYSCLEDFVDDFRAVKVTDYEGWREFEQYCRDDGVCFYDGLDDICERGLYFFDDDHDYWISWEYEYEKLRNLRRSFDY